MRRFLLLLLLPLAGCNPKLEASIEKVTPTDKGYEILVRTNRNAQVLPEGLTHESNATARQPAWVLLTFEELARLERPVKLIVTAGKDQKQVLELNDAQIPGELAPVAGPYGEGIDLIGPHVSTPVALNGSTAVIEFKLEPGQQLEVDGEEPAGSKIEVPLFPLIKDAKKFGEENETQKLGELKVKRSGAGPEVELSYALEARVDTLKALRAAFVDQVLKGGVPGEKTPGTQIYFGSFNEKWDRGFISGQSGKLALTSVATLVLHKQKIIDGPNCPNKYVNQETGEKVDVKRYHVNSAVEVYEAATGKRLGERTFNSKISECPETVMKRADMEASVGAFVDYKSIEAWVATVAL